MNEAPRQNTYAIRVDRVEELRKEKGMNYKTLAGLTGVHPVTLNRWLDNGRAFMDNIASLAAALGVKPDELIAGGPKPKRIRGTFTFEIDGDLDSPVLRKICEAIKTMAGLQDDIEPEGHDKGSIILHVSMTPEDVDLLVAKINYVKGWARRERFSMDRRRMTSEYMQSPAERIIYNATLRALFFIDRLIEIHFPATDLHEEVLWQEEGDKREEVKLPIP